MTESVMHKAMWEWRSLSRMAWHGAKRFTASSVPGLAGGSVLLIGVVFASPGPLPILLSPVLLRG